MLKCVFICQQQKLFAMVVEDEDDDKESTSKASHHSSPEKALVFLSSKNINDYISFKDKVCKQIMTNKFDFKPIFKRDNTDLVIDQSFKVDKFFKLETTFEI